MTTAVTNKRETAGCKKIPSTPPTVIVLVLAFTSHSSVEPTTLKNNGNSCSLVKWLSCLAGHMVRHVLCHMIRRMFRHPTMTHHSWWLVMGQPLSFLSIHHTSDWLPHSPLTPLCPATLLVGCTYPYRQPHFPLSLSLCSSHTSDWPPRSFFLFLFIPVVDKHVQM